MELPEETRNESSDIKPDEHCVRNLKCMLLCAFDELSFLSSLVLHNRCPRQGYRVSKAASASESRHTSDQNRRYQLRSEIGHQTFQAAKGTGEKIGQNRFHSKTWFAIGKVRKQLSLNFFALIKKRGMQQLFIAVFKHTGIDAYSNLARGRESLAEQPPRLTKPQRPWRKGNFLKPQRKQ